MRFAGGCKSVPASLVWPVCRRPAFCSSVQVRETPVPPAEDVASTVDRLPSSSGVVVRFSEGPPTSGSSRRQEDAPARAGTGAAMIRNDTENGGLICRVGIAPSTPAEFPIFRIHQKRLPLGGHTPRHTHRGTAGSRCGRPPPWVARPPLVADVASCLSNAASPRRTGPRSDRSRRVQHPSQRIDAGPGGRLPASHGAAAVPSQARGPARRRAAARGAGNTRGARRATRAHGEKRLTSRSHRPRSPVARRARRSKG